jgi:DNA-binding transcriptional ArsR family regulator
MTDFKPDRQTLGILGSEHDHGVWIGKRLLKVSNRIRSCGGSKNDYDVWVQASHLWSSYTGSTGDSVSNQGKNLQGAWVKSADSLDFDLEESLTDLINRISSARWVGAAGSRNRAVALAFVGFCSEHNCFTRTLSAGELSKYTAGMSPEVVRRGLHDLVRLGLLSRIDRTDKRTSKYSARRYEINLDWKPLEGASPVSANYTAVVRSTSRSTLPTLCNNTRDLWSSRGLGQTASRVYDALTDDAATIRDLSDSAGLSYQQTRHALAKLTDNGLAGEIPGRPVQYFKAEADLEAIEDMLGVNGHVNRVVETTIIRQEANLAAYPQNYAMTSHNTAPPF